MIAACCAAALAGTLIDATEREVTVGASDRLLVLSGGLTESVFAIGAGDRVIAADSTSVFPPEVERLPRLGYYRQLSAEGILALKPDAVIAPDDAGPPGVLDQVRAAGVDVVILPGAASADSARKRIEMLGVLLDLPTEAARVRADLDRALAGVPKLATAPRVLFVYARGAGTLQVAGQQTAADEMIALAGAQNAARGYTGYRPLTAEAIVAADPDVLLLTTRGLEAIGGVEAALALPGISLTKAGEAKRVVALDDLLLLGFGPRTGAAAQALAKELSSP